MASIKEVEGWVSHGTYPHVARTSDPLIVRVSKFSLLVNDTNFYAKIKNGLGYKGYLIYSSGLGTPILEESATNETEFFSNDAFKKAISDNGTDTGNKFYESAERVQTVLQDAAQSWLDTLELEIAKQPNDNAIKKAIDRLCWQLHYDITESHTNFPEVFKDNDFSDVQIDRYPMETEYWDGITLTTAISDSAGVTYKKDYGVDKCTITIENKGYLKDFDDHLTTETYETGVVGDKTIVTKGSLKTVFDEHLLGGMYSDSNSNIGAIKTFDEHLLKNSYDSSDGAFKVLHKKLQDLDDNMNGKGGSLIKIGTKLVPDNTTTNEYYSISECLREHSTSGTNGFTTYSIARSLREDIGSATQTSVSQATHDQTDLEENKFNEISVTKLGDFGSTGHKTLYATLGEYTDSTKNNLSQAVGYTTGNISVDGALGVTSKSTISVADRIGDTGGEAGASIADRLGVFSVTYSGTTRYRSLFDTINNGSDGYSNPNNKSVREAIGYTNSFKSLQNIIGTPLTENGVDGTEDSLFTAVYRHAGTLAFDKYTEWTGSPYINNNSVYSNLVREIRNIG